ncbi:CapA family protein [Planomicrobium sp. Y74]|uniref:CapA family protein n=1 Tax=Planomicrobium sp. Y74 TaxID=2478977 RepID=UPI000EF4F3E7|nr:CapA family protein [Planomicrobium sp. Y74]RLQ91545.1 CapA family protein [Planomicrobium sp. Y74]
MNAVRYSVFIAILLSTLMLAGCLVTKIPAAPVSANPVFEIRKTTPAIPDFSRTRTVSLSAIGDILIHGTVYDSAQTPDGYDFDPMFEKVKPYLEQSDITVANSESIIGGSDIGLSSYPSFNSPFEVGDALQNAGVDVVAMANNHTLDRGTAAIENAINYWDQIGMQRTGSYLSEEERDQVSVRTVNGITFSFLSYTYGTNGIPTPAGKEYLVNRIDKELIRKDLQHAKEHSEVAVLSLHFGDEYQPLPNEYQIDIARFAAENGADIILGHHPHVLQPPEWIETSDGREVFVIYSLGNFLSGQNEISRQIGTILTIDVEKKTGPDSTEISIQNPSFTNTFVKNKDYSWFEIDLLKNVHPDLNEQVKSHLSTWVSDLEFIE